ncbi:MAG: enoyl-CoA hydratase/isomerase family protein [Promethearchaeota archaeon]
MPEYETILYSKEGSFLSPAKNVAVIKMNRLDAMNAFNATILEELVAALQEAENDPEVRSVVIASTHEKVFGVGADLKEAQAFLGKPDEIKPLLKQGIEAIDTVAKLTKPVIAAVNGLCLGGGFELALASDIRICDTEAKLGAVEVGVGLIPSWGGCARLPRIVGLGKAMEMILTGGQFTAQEALDMGLVSKVVSKDELLSTAMWFGAKLGGNAPIAMKLAKQATHMAFEKDYNDNFEFQIQAGVECFKTKDLGEGIASVFEKRRGKFTGE